jgi:hypothetical protein
LSSAQHWPSSLKSAVSNTVWLLAVLGTDALVFFEGITDTITTPVTTCRLLSAAIAGAKLGVLGLYIVALAVTTGVLSLARRRRVRLDAIVPDLFRRGHTIAKRGLTLRRVSRTSRSILSGLGLTGGHLRGWRRRGCSRGRSATTGLRLGTTKHQSGQGGEQEE